MFKNWYLMNSVAYPAHYIFLVFYVITLNNIAEVKTMNAMRKWIDLINENLSYKPASAQDIYRIVADTEDNRKHLADIQRWQKEIDDEEQQALNIDPSVKRVPPIEDKDAWNDYWADFDLRYERMKRKQEQEALAAKRKQELEWLAHIDGVRLAAKDAMDDMIEADRETVSKLAQQALKSSEQQKQRLRKQALRQIKK